jgi:hypothetical protein
MMAYDWTGIRTRRLRRIKLAISLLASVIALAVPVFAVTMPFAG